MAWTEEQYRAHQAKVHKKEDYQKTIADAAHFMPPAPTPPPKTPKDRMNGTERRYAEHVLEPMQHVGEIVRWEYEPFKFRAMEDKFYKPDFAAWYPDGSITVIEVKAFNLHRSSLDRFQACREKYATLVFRFELWQWKGGQWIEKLKEV